MSNLSFTKGEAEFLSHRLTVPDALYDVVSEDSDEIATCVDRESVEHECTQLLGQIEARRRIDHIVADLANKPLRAILLRDAVEGSTYIACLSNDMPERADMGRAIRLAAIRVARSAVAKLRAVGFEVGNAPEF